MKRISVLLEVIDRHSKEQLLPEIEMEISYNDYHEYLSDIIAIDTAKRKYLVEIETQIKHSKKIREHLSKYNWCIDGIAI